MCFQLWGVVGFLARFRVKSTPKQNNLVAKELYYPPISILKPLKGIDENLEQNLRTFFELDYPSYEILFCMDSEFDHAYHLVQKLRGEYPHVLTRCFTDPAIEIPNPKVSNLWRSYHRTRYDLVLISDSNVRVPVRYLKDLAQELGPKVGMVTSIVRGTHAETFAGELESIYLNAFYAKGMILADHVGKTCVVGKTMLFHKKTLERLGGLKVIGHYLAEDYMAGFGIKHLGLEVKLSQKPVDQVIGHYTFKDFWKRHVRWGRIRKAQAPVAFLFEPLGQPIVISIFGSLVWGHWSIWFLNMTTFMLLDLLVLRAESVRVTPKVLVAWWVRECSSFVLWMHTLIGNSVDWRGNKMKVTKGGLLEV